MAFNPAFQVPCLFRDHPFLMPEIPTMFPSPSSVLIPPPHKNPLFNHTSTFHHFHDHNPTLLMEGFFSVSNPFNVPPVPLLGESSQAAMSPSGFVNPNINPVTLTPNNKIEALYGQQGGTFMSDLEKKAAIQSSLVFSSSHSQMGPSLSQPSYNKIEALYHHQGGTFMSDLEKKATIQSSAVFASSHSLMGPSWSQPPNKIEALYGLQGGTFMSDLEKKAAVQSSALFASSHSQMGPSLSLPPNHKIEALYGHEGGTFMSDLEKKAAVQSSAVFASSHPLMGPSWPQPPNNKIEALYGLQGGTFMSDLEKKAAVQSSAFFASSHSQMGPSLSLPPNHKIEALYGHEGGTFMSDLEIKAATQSFAVFASSHSQMGPLSQPPAVVDYDDLGSATRAFLAENISYPTEIYNINNDGEKMKTMQEESDNNTANTTKVLWSAQEDKVLVKLVNQYGQKNWSQVAKLMEQRTGKQCRDRWNNHLSPKIEKKPWTMKEDVILIKSHQKHGNKWVEIAKSLPGRSENTVKNHWNAAKRCRNIFKKKNAYKGSIILQAYIKRVAAAKEVERDTNE